ncbi:group II intron maturase-specific domain-containing protein [Bradyrhizobium sp. USDA 3315]
MTKRVAWSTWNEARDSAFSSSTSSISALRGRMRPHHTPKLKNRTAPLRDLKEVFRRHRSQPIDRVMNLVNSKLRGWVNYFAVGDSIECFRYVKKRIEKKVRHHIAHARKRQGFCCGRWNSSWLYKTLKLFNDYEAKYDTTKVAPT